MMRMVGDGREGDGFVTKTDLTRYWPLAVAVLVYAIAISLVNYRFGGTHSLLELTFGFGQALKSMLDTGRYQTCLPAGYYEHYGDYCLVAARMPLVPLFLWAMAKLTLWTLPALVIKNIVAYAVFAYAAARHSSFQALWTRRADLRALLREPRTLLFVAFALAAFLVPYNAFIFSKIDFEEGYFIAPLLLALAMLFELDVRHEFVLVGVLIALLIYIKASLWPVSLVMAVIVFFVGGGSASWAKKAIPLAILAVAYLAWGSFVYAETGHFAAGATMSSWSGEQLYRGNNPYAVWMYPRYSDDTPFSEHMPLVQPTRKFHDEWEANAYFTDRAKAYIAAHPGDVFELSLRKASVVLLDVRDNARMFTPDAVMTINPSLLVDRLLYFAAIAACLFLAYRRQVQWKPLVIGVLVAGAYAAPLIVGYAFNRHVVPFIVMILFCAAWIPIPRAADASGAPLSA